VARAVSRNIFKNQGSSWKFVGCGIIVDKDRGLNNKAVGIFWLGIYFLIGNVVDLVHGSWTAAPVGSPWTKDMAMVGSSPKLLVLADSGHGGPMRDGEKEEGATGIRFRQLLRLGRHRGGDTPAAKL
jgi:hypothetical protein